MSCAWGHPSLTKQTLNIAQRNISSSNYQKDHSFAIELTYLLILLVYGKYCIMLTLKLVNIYL